MATPKQKEAATKFLEGIVAKLPADKQQAFRDQYMSEEALLESVGDGVMARSDYSAQTAALAKERKILDDYYTENAPKVERAAKLLERFPDGVIPDDFGGDRKDPPVDIKAIEEVITGKVGKTIEQSERGAAAFMAKLADMSGKHLKEFGEVLNTSEIVNDPRVYEIGLDALYQEKHGAKYQAKADAARAAELEAAKKAGADEALAKYRQENPQQPFPTANAARNPVMAALHTEQAERLADPAKFQNRPFVNRVDAGAAAEEYQRLATTSAG